MKHVHFFQWNIPADNQLNGETDRFINVVAEFNGGFYSDGTPMCYVNPVNMTFYEAMQVKNWMLAQSQIKRLAESHFAELARQERINQARAVLQVEENPILSRLEINEY